MCYTCTRCGSKELILRGKYLGCLDCGKWCWELVNKTWVVIETTISSPLIGERIGEFQ